MGRKVRFIMSDCAKCGGSVTWWSDGQGWCDPCAPLAVGVTRCGAGHVRFMGSEECAQCYCERTYGPAEIIPSGSNVAASLADTQAALDEWDAFIASLKK